METSRVILGRIKALEYSLETLKADLDKAYFTENNDPAYSSGEYVGDYLIIRDAEVYVNASSYGYMYGVLKDGLKSLKSESWLLLFEEGKV